MENLNLEQFNELISKYKDSFYVICAGNGILKNNVCAAYIATSEESAKNYFNSIIDELPDNMKEFSALKVLTVENIYSFSNFFNGPSFKFIHIVDYGALDKELFIKKSPENVEYIKGRLKGFKDNDAIYSVYTKDNVAFTPTQKFRQHFFSNENDTNQFIEQYNNENLGLYSAFWEFDDFARRCLNELLESSFDGRDCSGWDIIEAAGKIYSESYLNENDIEELLNNNQLSILAATDGSNYVMRYKNDAIFFTSNEKAEKFLERNKNNITHEFKVFTVEKKEAFRKLILDSYVVYIDAEKHVLPSTFLIGAGLKVKPKRWESVEEAKEKAISLWNKDKLYIILSINNANLENNTSIPFIFSTNPFSLSIFEDHADAKRFIDNSEYAKLNDKYPIGIIDKSKVLWNLKTTLSIAHALNVPDVEFNPEGYENIRFKINEFFEFNGEKLSNNFSTLVPADNNVQNVSLQFNAFSFDFEENYEDYFYSRDCKPADKIEEMLLEEYKKVEFYEQYSKNSYKLFFYVLEHFIKYAKSSKNIKFYRAATVIDFIQKRNENDFKDMVNSYKVMDKSIIDENWNQTVTELKEIANKVNLTDIENLLKELRDLLFE